MRYSLLFFFVCILFACEKPGDGNDSPANLSFVFEFDETQERLDNFGNPAPIPQGNAGQTPEFQEMSVHWMELVPDENTIVTFGEEVYQGAETDRGGENAIDFDEAVSASEGQTFHSIPVGELEPGTYKYIRASVTYQKYNVKFNIKDLPLIGDLNNQTGTVASFIGFNSYISSVTPHAKTVQVNSNKKQGFWAFETQFGSPYETFDQITSGQAPEGATTVVNPLAGIIDIPLGSCIVTGEFAEPLVITGEETEDIKVKLSFSVNNSFEWEDANGNGQWDFNGDGGSVEPVVDMGLRGLAPSWE